MKSSFFLAKKARQVNTNNELKENLRDILGSVKSVLRTTSRISDKITELENNLAKQKKRHDYEAVYEKSVKTIIIYSQRELYF